MKGLGTHTMEADDLLKWFGRLAAEEAIEEDTSVKAVDISVPSGEDARAVSLGVQKAISTLPFDDGVSASTNFGLKHKYHFLCHSKTPPFQYKGTLHMGPTQWLHHFMLTQGSENVSAH